MEVLKKTLVVIGVLVVGVGLALLFRLRGDEIRDIDPEDSGIIFNAASDEGRDSQANHDGRQGVPVPGLGHNPKGRQQKTNGAASSMGDSPTVLVPGHAPLATPPTESLRAPPKFPPTFDRRIAPPLPKLSNFDDAPFGDDVRGRASSNEDESSGRASLPRESDGGLSRPRTHTIVNGDTLSRIAQRYLGDRERASEIYDLNRDTLSDADVLPLGRSIEIPPKKRPIASTGDAVDRPAPDAPTDRPAPKLVPLSDSESR